MGIDVMIIYFIGLQFTEPQENFVPYLSSFLNEPSSLLYASLLNWVLQLTFKLMLKVVLDVMVIYNQFLIFRAR